MTSETRPKIPEGAFISLTTFRRDGREVATPVWFVSFDDKVYAYSAGDAGKVKRVRATRKVRIAPCTYRGRIIGAGIGGRARIVKEPETAERVFAALARKYGLVYRFATLASYLTGKMRHRAVIEMELGDLQ